MLTRGQPAPDFELQGTDRERVSRSFFQGAASVLAFFPAAFTSGCTRELEAFQAALPELSRRGLTLAGVSTDTWMVNRQFKAAHRLDFPLLSDWPSGATCEAFGVLGPNGRSRRVTVMLDSAGVVLEVIDGVDATAHAARVLDATRGWKDGANSRRV
ncbi:MAG: peroxiredoxin [Dehalococcoidia bacterium]